MEGFVGTKLSAHLRGPRRLCAVQTYQRRTNHLVSVPGSLVLRSKEQGRLTPESLVQLLQMALLVEADLLLLVIVGGPIVNENHRSGCVPCIADATALRGLGVR